MAGLAAPAGAAGAWKRGVPWSASRTTIIDPAPRTRMPGAALTAPSTGPLLIAVRQIGDCRALGSNAQTVPGTTWPLTAIWPPPTYSRDPLKALGEMLPFPPVGGLPPVAIRSRATGPLSRLARIDGRDQAKPARSNPRRASPAVAAARFGRSAVPTCGPKSEHGSGLPVAT